MSMEDYLRVYSIQDSIILKEGLSTFFLTLKQNNIYFNKKSLSLSSVALNFYIKGWNNVNLNLSKRVSNVLRKAFYGGRCEVFGNPREGEKILYFDFRGMYQQCMVEKLPDGYFTLKTEGCNINTPGFYFIEIEAYNDIPVLPLRDLKLYFLNGKLCGLYWFEEILKAIEVGGVKSFSIKYGYICRDYDAYTAEFVEKLGLLRSKNPC